MRQVGILGQQGTLNKLGMTILDARAIRSPMQIEAKRHAPARGFTQDIRLQGQPQLQGQGHPDTRHERLLSVVQILIQGICHLQRHVPDASRRGTEESPDRVSSCRLKEVAN